MSTAGRRFHEILRETREQAQQTPEILALLLNLAQEDYQALEEGRRYPDNETLKRICMMLEWNYYDTQRQINNERSLPSSQPLSAGQGVARDGAAVRALQSVAAEQGPPKRSTGGDSLGSRMRGVREHTGQAEHIIAMLLSLDVVAYRQIEAGAPPSDELLRRISIVYDWNYYDLIALQRSEQAHTLQPRSPGSPFPGRSSHQQALRGHTQELESRFGNLAQADQLAVLAQLEMVVELVRRKQSQPQQPARTA